MWNMLPNAFKIALGKYSSDFSTRQPAEQIRDVSQIIVQPHYQDLFGNYGSDIAVIVLKTNVQFSPFVTPVCIDWNLHDINEHLSEKSLGVVTFLLITILHTYLF